MKTYTFVTTEPKWITPRSYGYARFTVQATSKPDAWDKVRLLTTEPLLVQSIR